MFQAFLDMILGPSGRAILDYYFAHQTTINSVFLVWAVILTYASFSLSKIRRQTILLGVEMLQKNPNLNDEQLWEKFRPKWLGLAQNVTARLIPGFWNIWFTRPTPEKLIDMMRLGPEWFGAMRNGEVLPCRYHVGKNDRLSTYKK